MRSLFETVAFSDASQGAVMLFTQPDDFIPERRYSLHWGWVRVADPLFLDLELLDV